MKPPPFFEEDRALVEAALERLLPPETAPPPSIHRAMRYSVFAGGKRIRPILCYEAARIFAADPAPAVPVGCALEFIHTYSLIHDDLPAASRPATSNSARPWPFLPATLCSHALLKPSPPHRSIPSAASR
jgi:hypothetical protein